MVSRVFLKPRSVQEPYEGDFQYLPIVKIYEADTAAALEAQMSLDFGIESESLTQYTVVESIQYSVAVIKMETGANDHMALYSALVHATQVLKV
jgi:hypothetical protein